ncbi:hypothetical protein D3OALGA1CA_5627 [Olavius algarvensis associated proteobacterium Delta 3]|nr:hypothetical protein D3OALGB2SA_25 [Olavius algarvensis associated proteobacterium Delta 3]CAB5169291.1 hypothetical protein D3OALGA1CA_5627 [Olavius algarvensis associated proteobacterium Delta 3]
MFGIGVVIGIWIETGRPSTKSKSMLGGYRVYLKNKTP